MSDSSRTPGEVVFEKYLDSQNIRFEFEKDRPGKSKRPDYTIEWEGETVVFDVKDFDPPKTFNTGFTQVDPYLPIREKINQGRDKFKQFKEYCCGLVLYNALLVSVEKAYIMLGAMYGDSGFTFPVNTTTGIGDASQLKPAFLNRGKMIRPKESNEAEMRQKIPDFDPYIEIPRVIVWHNAVARIPFPANLFCGDYDNHYGIVRRENGSVEQDVTYEGSAVPDRLKLLKPRKPPSS